MKKNNVNEVEYEVKLYQSSIFAMQKFWKYWISNEELDFNIVCKKIIDFGGYDSIGLNIVADELHKLVTTGYTKNLKTLGSFISEVLACYVANNNYDSYDVIAFLFCSSVSFRLSEIPNIGWIDASATYIIEGLNQIRLLFLHLDSLCSEELINSVFSRVS